jgi:hypothetical protein
VTRPAPRGSQAGIKRRATVGPFLSESLRPVTQKRIITTSHPEARANAAMNATACADTNSLSVQSD